MLLPNHEHPKEHLTPMLLKTRIIPKLLLKRGRTVKGTRFECLRDVGAPVSNARIYNAQTVDELLFLDIDGCANGESNGEAGRGLLLNIIAQTAEECFMPLTVGGGIRDVQDVACLLRAGADKIAVNTLAFESRTFLPTIADRYGKQCVIVSVDVKATALSPYEVWIRGGTQPTGIDVWTHLDRVVAEGAGEILLTSIDRDGTMQGYDLDLLREATARSPIPIIASGGAGTLQHLADAVTTGHASALAVGSLFHFTDQSPIKARSFLHTAGLNVRG